MHISQDWKDGTLIPLHKKNDKICDNYRGIALLSIPGKVLSLVIFRRLQTIIKPQLLKAQCGFRPGHSTVDQIWVTGQIVEGATEYRTPVHLNGYRTYSMLMTLWLRTELTSNT